jgi:hypothetical protein
MAVATPYGLQASEGYWFAEGDHKYTLSSDLRTWQQYPVPQRGDLPPLILSADDKAAIDRAAEERRRMGRVLDRAAALERWGPSPKRKKGAAKKRRAPVGRPHDYPIDIIRQTARDYIDVYGLPRSQAMLREKVRYECERNGFAVPGETRLKDVLRPIYQARSRRKSQSH